MSRLICPMCNGKGEIPIVTKDHINSREFMNFFGRKKLNKVNAPYVICPKCNGLGNV